MEKENKKEESKVKHSIEIPKIALSKDIIEKINNPVSLELAETFKKFRVALPKPTVGKLQNPIPPEVIRVLNELTVFQKGFSLKISKFIEEINFNSFFQVRESLNNVLKSFKKMMDQIDLNKLLTEQDIEPLRMIDLYTEHFEEKNILIDKEFYAFILERYPNKDMNKDRGDSWQENILIEYLDQKINTKKLNFEITEKSKQSKVLFNCLLPALEQKNWVAAAFLLHTFIDKTAEIITSIFNKEDLSTLRKLAEKDSSEKVGLFSKEYRVLFASAIEKSNLLGYQMNEASIGEAIRLCPYVSVFFAINFYDNLPRKISRNSLIHFKNGVRYDEINKTYVYRLIQTVKVLEQQIPLDKAFIIPVLKGIRELKTNNK